MRKKKALKYLLIFIGLYIVYFITGLLLTKNHVVDEWVIFPNTVMRDSKQKYAPPGTDGPHIFYADSSIIVKSVVLKDTTHIATTDTFHNKDSLVIKCKFDEHPDWNFTTRLKDTLTIESSTYSEADSFLAISDIEGEFEAFRKLLLANHVIDDSYNWTYGSGHLVLVGDFFDRGTNVTEVLWLIYLLEEQAKAQGGKVHFILGNHEIMNLQNDLRYVSGKYKENASLLNADYKEWYTLNTELGRWLNTKNVIEQIGGTIFTHGGFSEEMNELSLSMQEINEVARKHYFVNKNDKKNIITEDPDVTIHNYETSPFWFRGYARDDATQQQVNKTMLLYHANAIVIGHTVVDEVTTFYDGRVIDIDTKHSKGYSEGLYYSNGKYYKVDTSGQKYELE